jgi:hypothetical protein
MQIQHHDREKRQAMLSNLLVTFIWKVEFLCMYILFVTSLLFQRTEL